MSCEYIYIFKGDDTNWNNEQFLTFVITGQGGVDLSTMTATFTLGSIVKEDISLESGTFQIALSAAETSTLVEGSLFGSLQIFDADDRVKTVCNTIPFYVTNRVIVEQNQEIQLDLPQGSPVTINLTVGSGGSGGGTWGSITGNIQDQTDLQDVLNAKVSKSGDTMTGALSFGDFSISSADGMAKIEGTQYGLRVDTTSGLGAALFTANGMGNVVTSLDVKSTYSSTGTDPVNGTAVASAISPITEVIPNQASSSNQLADKNFVNSSIATNTANFIGTFETLADLQAYSGSVTNNDYAFVVNSVITDNGSDWSTLTDLNAYDKSLLTNFDYAWVVNGNKFDLYRFDIVEQTWELRAQNIHKDTSLLNTAYNRYKATVSGSTVTWMFEYTLNNSSFTASQWAAINSGITDSLVTDITTAVQPSDLATVATTGSYTDLTNKPTIPTVDQVYSAESANAQSGVAVASAISGKQNKTLDTSITVDGTAQTTVEGALGAINTLAGQGLKNKCRDTETSLFISPNQTDEIGTAGNVLYSTYFGPQAQTTFATGVTVIGSNSITQYNYGTSVGANAKANQGYCTAIGSKAKASGGRNAQYGGSTALGSDANANGGTALGSGTNASSTSVAIGRGYDSTNVVTASGNRSIAIGALSGTSIQCKATGIDSIQLGKGVNSTAQLFQVYSYPLLDGNTGKIPADRLPDGIGVSADGETIIQNQDDTISTVAVKEQNASVAIKQWVGTKAEYDLIDPKDPDTIYVVTDDNAGGITQIDGFNANAPVQRLANLYGVQKWQTQELWYSNFSTYTVFQVTQTLPSTISSIDVILEATTSTATHVQNLFLFLTNGSYGSGIFWEKSTTAGHQGQLGYWDESEVTYFNAYVTSTPSTTWFRAIGDNSSQTLYYLTDNNYTIETLPELSQWTNLGTMHESYASKGMAFSSEGGNYFDRDGVLKNYYIKANGNLFFDLRTGEGMTLVNGNTSNYKASFDIRREYHWK